MLEGVGGAIHTQTFIVKINKNEKSKKSRNSFIIERT